MSTTTTPQFTSTIPEAVLADYTLSAGLTAEEVARRARELVKYLFLCANTQSPLVPSPAVDDIWHDFILHTRAYAEYCADSFGIFIHHLPSRTHNPSLRDRYLQTIAALETHFGTLDEYIWPRTRAFLSETCNDCQNN
jgi:hypothetical protein